MIKRLIFCLAVLVAFVTTGFAQLSGTVLDANQQPAVGVEVSIPAKGMSTITNATGKFRFLDLNTGNYVLKLMRDGFETQQIAISPDDFDGKFTSMMKAGVSTQTSDTGDEISTISEFELFEDDAAQISSMLTASRDPFNNAAAFNLRAARFRIRGYQSEYNHIYINGININTLNSGRAFFGMWGGLNDMFRLRDEAEGLQTSSYALGGIAGTSNFDLRSSKVRKQLKASYSLANTSYRHRAMLSYGSGVNAKGWAFSASLSKRWAEEGYVSGTFYDGYSGYVGVEKQFSPTHSLSLVAFSVNTIRGRSSASTQEAYDLAGDNFYNPNWGYLNGEKRNPRQYRNNLHTAILRYDNMLGNAQLSTAVAFQTGKDGQSGIDWYDAADPRPDYYRKLPSFIEDPVLEQKAIDYLSADPNRLQLDLEKMYIVNNNNLTTIQAVDGITGNDVAGKLAAYKIQETRYDPTKLLFNGTVNKPWTDNLVTIHGITAAYESIHNHKVVDNLMGADFAVDWDNFADNTGDQSLLVDSLKQNDLQQPNRLLKEGDVFGYNYNMVHTKYGAWSQVEYSLNNIDFMVAGGLENTSFYREGLYQFGKFPNISKGKSDTKNYLTGTAKANITYKINGRNYVYASGAYLTVAPTSRNSFITPRTRNTLIDDLDVQKVTAGELGYVARFPRIKGRASVYYTEMKDQFVSRNVYFDQQNAFGNMITKGIDTRHMGAELGAEIKLTQTLSTEVAVALGDFEYTSNPDVLYAVDDIAEIVNVGKTYYKGHYVSSGPQNAGTVELTYRNPKFWSVSVSANYFDKSFINISPLRRTELIGDILQENVIGPQIVDLTALEATTDANDVLNSELTKTFADAIFTQEQYPSAMTFDVFARKSWKLKSGTYIALNASVNNITNNIFKSGGFEQSRLRYRGYTDENGDLQLRNLFPPRYYYAYGTTYFITLSVSPK